MELTEKVRQWLELLPIRVRDSSSIDIAIQVFHSLRKIHCCHRCCLRFIGCRDLSLYRASEEELANAFRAFDQSATEESGAPCTACLGALQYADTAAFLDPVCERLEKENYESGYVNLTCTIPISVMHRDHLLSIYVCDQLDEEAKCQWKNHAVRDPKDPFKAIWGEKLTERSGLKIDPSSPLRMTVVLEHNETSSEHLFLTQTKVPLLKVRKFKKGGRVTRSGDSRSSIAEALRSLDDTEARSQTPWAVNGKKLAEKCVSECIGEVLKQHCRGDDYKFVPAGREDANVRMLGSGRPFYCEIINPRRPVLSAKEFKEMEDEINALPSKDDVQVRQLLQVQSRAAAVREKEIHFVRIDCVPEDQHLAILTLNTQAGTYIKEFVHGDLGRTLPNLASIAGVKAADLIDLDVLEVDLEWPPSLMEG
ncbi:putative tRNA pseudouridine synthase Pus10 [Apophysomyces ossiformis]|uniref:tRNA pseudouridine(55) synthase n=1 Tax=Apophysomyces ossiformis TaxID=679940 RepID=A0A8H7BJP9_9FUNG|nr:putative tRNA pseudouridine synthase Pus10 [Apophysomyces ossiformis]